ncbi:MAG TPA: TIGR03435 family protein [Bryobacteraceae bacterium]
MPSDSESGSTAQRGRSERWNWRWIQGGQKFLELGPDPGYNITVSRCRGELSAQTILMRQFVEILGYVVDVALMDKAGITGEFDAKLDFSRSTPADAPAGADIRTALRDQLGLKLTSVKLPVDVLVVDSMSRPSDS